MIVITCTLVHRFIFAAVAAFSFSLGPVLAAETGDIAVENAVIRATVPTASVAAGYMTIINTTDMDDSLLAIVAPGAERVEVHEMVMDGDVMKMRPVAGGLAIAAGETLELKPGGLHLMIMGLTAPLVAGESVVLRIIFETSGAIDVPFAIIDRTTAIPVRDKTMGN
jgi:copper(I)-binding protein